MPVDAGRLRWSPALPPERPFKPAQSGWSAVARSGLMLRALGDYARLTVLPTGLHMDRGVDARRMYLAKGNWRGGFAFDYLSLVGLAAGAALLLAGALSAALAGAFESSALLVYGGVSTDFFGTSCN